MVRRMTRLARAWAHAAVTCLVLLGSATSASGAAASAALPMPSASALLGVSRSVPRPGSSSQLVGISCTSPSSCWAVGRDTVNGAELNQALHWNGRKWSPVPIPSPGGTATASRSELNGVSCASPASCWAVGDFFKSRFSALNQALHWNGRRWSLVAVPSPGGTASVAGSSLTTVRCTSPASCWAVGDYRPPGSSVSLLNQALHWNGRHWSLVATPVPGRTASGGYGFLNGVRCTSPGNCWAVGGFVEGGAIGRGALLNQVLHWNGRTWSQASAPDPGGTRAAAINLLDGVACTSSGNCWAIGSYGTLANPRTNLNQALHWNGRRWSLVATPHPGGIGASSELLDVTCISSTSCWAVGDYGSRNASSSSLVNEALRWNGHAWSLVSTPDPGGMTNGATNFLFGIRCPSSASCWAVGDSQASGPEVNQALHWNGRRWSVG
jgi:hypothetical protein